MSHSLALLFVLFSVGIRLVPHLPNFSPIIGMGLFCGAAFPRRWALFVPLAAMGLGDLLLGWVPENFFGYIAIALSVGIGCALRTKRSPIRIAGASLAGSTLFYLISNGGVWLLGMLYPRTLEGLIDCYAAGIPFYRNSILGDLVYTGVLFWCAQWVTRRVSQRSPAAANASR